MSAMADVELVPTNSGVGVIRSSRFRPNTSNIGRFATSISPNFSRKFRPLPFGKQTPPREVLDPGESCARERGVSGVSRESSVAPSLGRDFRVRGSSSAQAAGSVSSFAAGGRRFEHGGAFAEAPPRPEAEEETGFSCSEDLYEARR